MSSDASLEPAPSLSPIPYELRIGVTGHISLPDPDAVKARVRELLDRLLIILQGASTDPFGPYGTYRPLATRLDRRLAEGLSLATAVVAPLENWTDDPTVEPPSFLRRTLRRMLWPAGPVSPRHPKQLQQTPIKLTVISCLAAGADQLVARAVCDVVAHESTKPGALKRNRWVEAVLPVPQAIYEQEFANAAALDEFRALLKLDRGCDNEDNSPWICVEDLPADANLKDPAIQAAMRAAFALAGRKMIDTSEIVIAIWDPTRSGDTGGTASTVHEALDRGRLVFWLNPTALEDGVWVLQDEKTEDPARTESQDRPAPPPGCRVMPVPTRAKDISSNFHRLAAYNRDAAITDQALQRALEHEAKGMIAAAEACRLPQPVRDTLTGHLLPKFVRADLLSQKYRRLRGVAALVWPLSAALVVMLMAFQIIFLPSHYWIAYIELAVLALGYLSNRVSVHEEWHDKWLHDRRLAEGLRSAMFAVLISDAKERPKDPSRAADNELPFYNPANTWYVASMKREVAKARRGFGKALSLDNPGQRTAVSRFLREVWVLPQAAHHERNAQRQRELSARGHHLRLLSFVLVLAVALAHALGVGHDAPASVTGVWRWDLRLAFLTVVLPAWAGALHVMWTLDDHGRFADRSERMAKLLEGLADRFDTAQEADDVRARVEEAERILDLESADWAESLTDRRPEFTV
jgi:hypothetical protein